MVETTAKNIELIHSVIKRKGPITLAEVSSVLKEEGHWITSGMISNYLYNRNYRLIELIIRVDGNNYIAIEDKEKYHNRVRAKGVGIAQNNIEIIISLMKAEGRPLRIREISDILKSKGYSISQDKITNYFYSNHYRLIDLLEKLPGYKYKLKG